MLHDHGYHELTIAEVVCETDDARSFVLRIPEALRDAYLYSAGQFCTFRFRIDGEDLMRCYSMSSSPDVGDRFAITVKRVDGGRVSNHMIDRLAPGDTVEASVPTGVFCLTDDPGEIVAFAGGSGITPVISIVKSALATTNRAVRLFYANRDRDSVIFADELDSLASAYADRLALVHHLDDDRGYATTADIEGFLGGVEDAHYYLCGPTPFMDLVEATLTSLDVAKERIHSERFTAPPTPGAPTGDSLRSGTLSITLHDRTKELVQTPGETLLDAARRAGLSPPFSCELGNCATCMARLVEGTVELRNNTVLEPDELEEGWILTCQGVPTSERVSVIYED